MNSELWFSYFSKFGQDEPNFLIMYWEEILQFRLIDPIFSEPLTKLILPFFVIPQRHNLALFASYSEVTIEMEQKELEKLSFLPSKICFNSYILDYSTKFKALSSRIYCYKTKFEEIVSDTTALWNCSIFQGSVLSLENLIMPNLKEFDELDSQEEIGEEYAILEKNPKLQSLKLNTEIDWDFSSEFLERIKNCYIFEVVDNFFRTLPLYTNLVNLEISINTTEKFNKIQWPASLQYLRLNTHYVKDLSFSLKIPSLQSFHIVSFRDKLEKIKLLGALSIKTFIFEYSSNKTRIIEIELENLSSYPVRTIIQESSTGLIYTFQGQYLPLKNLERCALPIRSFVNYLIFLVQNFSSQANEGINLQKVDLYMYELEDAKLLSHVRKNKEAFRSILKSVKIIKYHGRNSSEIEENKALFSEFINLLPQEAEIIKEIL